MVGQAESGKSSLIEKWKTGSLLDKPYKSFVYPTVDSTVTLTLQDGKSQPIELRVCEVAGSELEKGYR